MARFIEIHASGDAIFGTANAGVLGYFTNRHIINIDGLVNSYSFLESMKNQASHLYLRQIGVNWIFIGPGHVKHEPYTHMLDGKLDIVATWIIRLDNTNTICSAMLGIDSIGGC